MIVLSTHQKVNSSARPVATEPLILDTWIGYYATN
jgi:hypothetical protein